MSASYQSIKKDIKRFVKSINSTIYIHILSVGIGLILIVFGVWQLIKPGRSSASVLSSSNELSNNGATMLSQQMIIEVSGAVKNPGIYQLQYGARVAHAVNKAGGIDEQAVSEDLLVRQINLSRIVHDGEKIFIPLASDLSVVSEVEILNKSNLDSLYVSINTSSHNELLELSGIGEVRAEKIIQGRPYYSKRDLLKKEVLSETLYRKIEAQLVL